jgi:hypothetical protein
MRYFAAIVALCAAAFLAVMGRHWWVKDPRMPSQGALGGAILILLASTMVALARPSPYPPVTQFNGDRYGSAQLGPEVARDVRRQRAGKARYLYPTRKRAPVSRKRWRHDPIPAPRPLAEPGSVEPLSVAQGAWREAGRALGRPRAWCGWWLGQHLGMPLRELWLARNWARVGSSAGGPRIGAIVVWRHHVGIITGRQGNKWVVKSGNDGGRVRERARSVAGAIAFRSAS